jgi:putative serine/threonine protein kinase
LSATQSERADLQQLVRTPYIGVLTYPKISLPKAKARVKQLRALGVEELLFEGRAKVGRLGLLGIGTVGVVVRARVGSSVVALKIRRTDANRPNMDEEFRLTSMANRVGVGVPALGHSRDFMLTKLLEYEELHDWVARQKGPGTRERVRDMVHAVLNQCRKLDIMGLDHGELSNLRKHVVVAEGSPWILDFESAGTSRRPRNVTAAAQYMLVGGKMAPMLRRTIGLRDTKKLIRLLGEYKEGLGDTAYARLLLHLKLV